MLERFPQPVWNIFTICRAGVLLFCFATVSLASEIKPTCKNPSSGPPSVTMWAMGRIGRFGNQIFQYIFAKLYEKKRGVLVELPKWDGEYLFGLKDKHFDLPFCRVEKDEDMILDSYLEKLPAFSNVDFFGYFQYNMSLYSNDKTFIRNLFQPSPSVLSIVSKGLNSVRKRGKTLVSIHLRRGDFGPMPFPIAPTEWYLKWLSTFWKKLDRPVLFIASDEIDLVKKDFAAYHPISATDLNISLPQASYFLDHYILTHSDVIAISNSTFSASAAILNSHSDKFYRPDFDQKKVVKYDPWKTKPWEKRSNLTVEPSDSKT